MHFILHIFILYANFNRFSKKESPTPNGGNVKMHRIKKTPKGANAMYSSFFSAFLEPKDTFSLRDLTFPSDGRIL